MTPDRFPLSKSRAALDKLQSTRVRPYVRTQVLKYRTQVRPYAVLVRRTLQAVPGTPYLGPRPRPGRRLRSVKRRREERSPSDGPAAPHSCPRPPRPAAPLATPPSASQRGGAMAEAEPEPVAEPEPESQDSPNVAACKEVFAMQVEMALGAITPELMQEFIGKFSGYFGESIKAEVNPSLPGPTCEGDFGALMGMLGPIWIGFVNTKVPPPPPQPGPRPVEHFSAPPSPHAHGDAHATASRPPASLRRAAPRCAAPRCARLLWRAGGGTCVRASSRGF
eukprot:SAG31_NODE_2767_length_5122_cov_7.978101_5_plen_279_part_00